MKKIMVAGHICLDVTPIFNNTNTMSPGKLIVVGPASIHLGGCVANTGLALHFFNSKVKLLGKVGDDEFGSIVSNEITKSGAENSIITSKKDCTSYSVVIAQPGIDRIFLHCPGANDTFCFSDLSNVNLDDVSLFHLGYPPIMKQLYLNDGKELASIFKTIHQKSIVTSLDLSSIDENAEVGKVDWFKILQNSLPYVDLFMPSVEELMFILDKEKYYEISKKTGDFCLNITISHLQDLAAKVHALGCNFVIIKAGACGMYYSCNGNPSFIQKLELNESEWCNQSGFQKSYKPEKIASATGCGDTAIAAFLHSITNKKSLKKSIQLAALTGSCCITAYDALSGLKSIDEMEKMLQGKIEEQNYIKE